MNVWPWIGDLMPVVAGYSSPSDMNGCRLHHSNHLTHPRRRYFVLWRMRVQCFYGTRREVELVVVARASNSSDEKIDLWINVIPQRISTSNHKLLFIVIEFKTTGLQPKVAWGVRCSCFFRSALKLTVASLNTHSVWQLIRYGDRPHCEGCCRYLREWLDKIANDIFFPFFPERVLQDVQQHIVTFHDSVALRWLEVPALRRLHQMQAWLNSQCSFARDNRSWSLSVR